MADDIMGAKGEKKGCVYVCTWGSWQFHVPTIQIGHANFSSSAAVGEKSWLITLPIILLFSVPLYTSISDNIWGLRFWAFLGSVKWLDWTWWLRHRIEHFLIIWVSYSSSNYSCSILLTYLVAGFSSSGPFVLVRLGHFYSFTVILMGIWEGVYINV